MFTTLKWTLLLILLFYLLVMAAMYIFQRHLLYFPRNADSYEMPHNYEFRHDGVVLRGWVLNADAGDALVYYGGNAELIDHNINWMGKLFPGYAVYLVSYRGYGGSEGIPTEEHISADALAVFDDIASRHRRTSLIGRSLGSGVATHVAANREVHRMVLVTPYDSIQNVAKSHYPLFPVARLLNDTWKSWQNARRISTRTLLLYGGKDNVVPPDSTERLIGHFDEDVIEVVRIAEADHDDILGRNEAVTALVDFLGGTTAPLK